MEFPWKECRSGLPFLSPRDLLDPGIEPTSPVFPILYHLSHKAGKPWEFLCMRSILPHLFIQSFVSIMSISTDSEYLFHTLDYNPTLYSVALIIPALGTRSSFSWFPCSSEIVHHCEFVSLTVPYFQAL